MHALSPGFSFWSPGLYCFERQKKQKNVRQSRGNDHGICRTFVSGGLPDELRVDPGAAFKMAFAKTRCARSEQAEGEKQTEQFFHTFLLYRVESGGRQGAVYGCQMLNW